MIALFRFESAALCLQASTQRDIYEQSIRPLVDAALAGYNATVFAYGQTGSGKTYTMGSASCAHLEPSETGMLPRALQAIFASRERREAEGAQSSMVLRASFLEIHNEELRDLLAAPEGPLSGQASGVQGNAPRERPRLAIREDPGGGIYFAGAEEREVTTIQDMLALLEQGTERRATGSTEMNQHSSRSHAIFSLVIEQHVVRELEDDGAGAGGAGDLEEYITSKFHFVDLAGSERIKKTKAEGERLKEGININAGLLALGNVISALGDESKRATHVPYRDSKLTRMLQDSLGGNSRTLMIACVSPVESNLEETISTLKYANRARNIKNTPVINRDPNSHLITQLRKEVAMLRSILRDHGVTNPHSNAATPDPFHAAHSRGQESYFGARDQQMIDAGSNPIQVRALEARIAEQGRLIDDFKLAFAEIYTCTAQLQHQAALLRTQYDPEDSAASDGFGQMERLLSCIQGLEEQCRLKSVFVAAKGGIPRSSMSAAPASPSLESCALWSEAAPECDAASSAGDGLPPRLSLGAISSAGEGEEAEDGAMTERGLAEGAEEFEATLVEKERLLAELVRNQREYDTMRGQYERKMEHLQFSIRAMEREREQTLSELAALDKLASQNASRSGDQMEKARRSQRLKQLEDELRQMRKKVKDHERLLSYKEQGEHKIATLSEEVQRLKASRTHLSKKMARDARGHREARQELERQITSLQRADKAAQRTIRELEGRLESAAVPRVREGPREKALRRRQQIAMQQRRDREAQAEDMAGAGGPGQGDPVAWFKALLERGRRGREARAVLSKGGAFKERLAGELRECRAQISRGEATGGATAMLQGLRDEAEYLSAEMDFRIMEEDKARAAVTLAGRAADDLAEWLPRLSDEEARRVVQAAYLELQAAGEAGTKAAAALHEAQVHVEEGRRTLQEERARADAQSAGAARELDAQLTSVQREYEAKLRFVFEQLEEARVAAAQLPNVVAKAVSLPGEPSTLTYLADAGGARPNVEHAQLEDIAESAGEAEGDAARRGRGGVDVTAVQNRVMEKADRILAASRRGEEPRSSPGGVQRTVGGWLSPGLSPLAAPSDGAPETAAPADVSYVADLLKRSSGDQRKSASGAGSGDARLDRRKRAEELAMKLNPLWEAMQVHESHRQRFRQLVSTSSKPESSLSAYEREYAAQLRSVEEALAEARAELDKSWEEVGAGQAERERVLAELAELAAPDRALDALARVRAELGLLRQRVALTQQIEWLLLRRQQMLTMLSESASGMGGAGSTGAARKGGGQSQEGLRKIVRDYPKVVDRLQRYIRRWEEVEGRQYLHQGSRASELLTQGDADVLFRAMHVKLMSGPRATPGAPATSAASPRIEHPVGSAVGQNTASGDARVDPNREGTPPPPPPPLVPTHGSSIRPHGPPQAAEPCNHEV